MNSSSSTTSFLLKSVPQLKKKMSEDGEEFEEEKEVVLGLLSGGYQLYSFLERLQSPLSPVRLCPFKVGSEGDELAEFRLLNYKDRVIIRALDRGAVFFGIDAQKELMDLLSPDDFDDHDYLSLDAGAMLVLYGPVTIRFHVLTSSLEKKEVKIKDGEKEGDDHEDDDENAGDAIKKTSLPTQPSTASYSGHVTLSLTGMAFVKVNNEQTEIDLPIGSSFTVDRNVPYRFQQQNIVQLQRNHLQATQGMMALESFDHLLELLD